MKLPVKAMIEVEELIDCIRNNSNFDYDTIQDFLFEIGKYPEVGNTLIWNEPKHFDDDDKHPIMLLIYKMMESEQIECLYVSLSI